MNALTRRRRIGGGVGALATVIVLVVALFTLGGQGSGDPAGRPESADRGSTSVASPLVERRVADRVDGSSGDPTGLLVVLPERLAAPLVALVLLGVTLVTVPPARPARPVPVRIGRAPPTSA